MIRTNRARRVPLLIAAALIATVAQPAVAKDDPGPGLDPTPGTVVAATGCLGAPSAILHPPAGPDIAWPFGPGVVASADLVVQIIDTAANDIARISVTDTSANLPVDGEDVGPDAVSFNLGIAIDESAIRVISPSTLKRFRTNVTPGGAAPFGEFDYEVRRDEHDDSVFVFEIVAPGVDLTLADFGTNELGHGFVSRINGIAFAGKDENRAFSTCTAIPDGSGGNS